MITADVTGYSTQNLAFIIYIILKRSHKGSEESVGFGFHRILVGLMNTFFGTTVS